MGLLCSPISVSREKYRRGPLYGKTGFAEVVTIPPVLQHVFLFT